MALEKYRADLKAGKIDKEALKQKHIEDLEAQLKKAQDRVDHIQKLINRAKCGGCKTSLKRNIDNLDSDQLAKLQELLKTL